jgi:hypothetical protein
MLYERLSARYPPTIAVFAHIQMLTALAALLFLVFFRELPAIVPPILRITHQSFAGLAPAQFLTCALAMLPAAIVFGFNFPAVAALTAVSSGRGIQSAEQERQTERSGDMYDTVPIVGEEAIAEMKKALELDPLSLPFKSNLGMA